MAISPTTIDNWLRTTTEHQRLEFKRAETQINQDDILSIARDDEDGSVVYSGWPGERFWTIESGTAERPLSGAGL